MRDRPEPLDVVEVTPHGVTLAISGDQNLSYRFYREGETFYPRRDYGAGFAYDEDLEQGETRWYSVSARVRWGAGRSSVWAEPVFVTTPAVDHDGILLTATVNDRGLVRLDWDSVPGTFKYRVYRNGFVERVVAGDTSFGYLQGRPGETIVYQVSAIDLTNKVESPRSNPVEVVVPGVSDGRPIVQVAYRETDRLVLRTSPVAGASEYRLYNHNTLLASSSDGWFVMDEVDRAAGMVLAATSVVDGRESPGSSSLFPYLVLVPAAPIGVINTFTDRRNVVLRIPYPESGVGGHNVYRNGELVARIGTASVYYAWFTDHDLEPGTAYTYWVSNVSYFGFESQWSEPIFVRTEDP